MGVRFRTRGIYVYTPLYIIQPLAHNSDTFQCIGRFGTVKGFTGSGDVLVGFDPHNFKIYIGALRKVG